MRARGFTLIEVSIVMTISALLVPLVYLFARNVERDHYRALWQVSDARAARTVAEELRRDRWTMQETPGQGGSLVLKGDCGEVRYVVEGSVLFRRGGERCGGDRALARPVKALALQKGYWALDFEHAETTSTFATSFPLVTEAGR